MRSEAWRRWALVPSAAWVIASGGAASAAEPTLVFDIPRQPLKTALIDLAIQGGVSISTQAASGCAALGPPLRGRFTLKAGLDALLAAAPVAVTAAVAVPLHRRLGAEPDRRLIDALLRANLIRTVAWTVAIGTGAAMVTLAADVHDLRAVAPELDMQATRARAEEIGRDDQTVVEQEGNRSEEHPDGWARLPRARHAPGPGHIRPPRHAVPRWRL